MSRQDDLALRAAYTIRDAPGKIRKLVVPAAVGVGGAAVAAGALWLGLDFAFPIAGIIGLGVGAGGTMLALPPKPDPEPSDAERVASVLGEIRTSAIAEGERIRALKSMMWRAGSAKDGKSETSAIQTSAAAKAKKRLMGVCERLHGIASMPDIVERTHVDADLLMLRAIATETLPQVVELAAENDRMYSSASPEAKRDIAALAEGIGEQARILAEAVGRIEADVIAGTSRDMSQHLEYVRARFSKLGIDDAADFDRAFRELEA